MTKRGVWFAASPLFPQFLRGVSPRAVKTDGSAFPARRKRKKAAALFPQEQTVPELNSGAVC